jgi:hypothetical protein
MNINKMGLLICNKKNSMNSTNHWPALSYENWSDALDTLHMKMQIIGKVKLVLNPFLNQWWQVAFHLNMKGITTGLIPYKDGVFEIEFNFINHNLSIRISNNQEKIIPLFPSSVAVFYGNFMDTLKSMGIHVAINTLPCEFSDPVKFELDNVKKSYDKTFVHTWWKILIQIQKVFESFRSGFRGKSSPVHFFWGSFDLCETRFSGKNCAIPAGAGRIMKFAENEENFTFGFWPGDKNYPHAAFYSYFYPAPEGIETPGNHGKNYYNNNMKEYILDYQEVIESQNPEESILKFLNETYDIGARAAGWDVESLKAEIPV